MFSFTEVSPRKTPASEITAPTSAQAVAEVMPVSEGMPGCTPTSTAALPLSKAATDQEWERGCRCPH